MDKRIPVTPLEDHEAEQSTKIAAEEIKEKKQSADMAASFDGSWQKPGHASLNGIVSAISKGLTSAIVQKIEPVYEAFSEDSLLSPCLDSYTQNPNESLNNLIWKRCPKKIYQGKLIVELCTANAVTQFNDGASSIAAVLK
eukprot:gene16962-8461_t